MVQILYSDDLIHITEESLSFRRYYFPFGSKTIDLSSIDFVEVLPPTLLSGKWRIHGTGNFRTWFPHDIKRPNRDCIFIVHRHQTWWRIGFTVENSGAVRDVLELKNIPVKDYRPA